MSGRRFILMALSAAMAASCARLSPDSLTKDKSGPNPRDIAVPDLDGVEHTPLAPGDQKATVLIFIATDCPISNTYAPEISRIVKDYSDKGIAFYLVHVDPLISIETARTHAREFSLAGTILLDRQHLIVDAVGVEVMPEAAVLVPGGDGAMSGTPVYLGRIDDRYVDFGKRRFKASQHDLRDAIDAVLEGRPIETARTKAVGCFIPRLPRE